LAAPRKCAARHFAALRRSAKRRTPWKRTVLSLKASAPDSRSAQLSASLFHGLDFRKLQAGAASFDFGTFFFALTVLVVWAFALGFVFGWIAERLDSKRVKA
jgi:hypothetical protein